MTYNSHQGCSFPWASGDLCVHNTEGHSLMQSGWEFDRAMCPQDEETAGAECKVRK